MSIYLNGSWGIVIVVWGNDVDRGNMGNRMGDNGVFENCMEEEIKSY